MATPYEPIVPTPRTDAAEAGLEKAAEEHAGTEHEAAAWKGSFGWMTGHARALERELAAKSGPADGAKALAAKLTEADAARYRWLNKKYDLLLKVGENDDDYTKRHVALKCGPELDRWIDRHLEEEAKRPATSEGGK